MNLILNDFPAISSLRARIQRRFFLSSFHFETQKQLKGVEFWNNSERNLNVSYIPEGTTDQAIADFFQAKSEVDTAIKMFGCWIYKKTDEQIIIYDPAARVGFYIDKTNVTLYTGGHFRLSFSNLSAMLCICDGGFPLHSCSFFSENRLICLSGDGGIGKTKTGISVVRDLGMFVLNDDLNLLYPEVVVAYDRPAAVYSSHLSLLNKKPTRRIYQPNLTWRIINKIAKSFGQRLKLYFEYDLVSSREIFKNVANEASLRDKTSIVAYCRPVSGLDMELDDDPAYNVVSNIINSSLHEFRSNNGLMLSAIVAKNGSLENGLKTYTNMIENSFTQKISVAVGQMASLDNISNFWKNM